LHWYAAVQYTDWKIKGKAAKFVTMTNAFRSTFHLLMLHILHVDNAEFFQDKSIYSECIVVRKLACARFSYRIAQYADCCFLGQFVNNRIFLSV
jgi:hypothetical protein